MTEVGREALHTARERVDPIERRVFGVFAPKDLAAFREFLSRFIEAFEGSDVPCIRRPAATGDHLD